MMWLALALAGPIDESATKFSEGDLPGATALLEPLVHDGWSSGFAKFNLGDVHYRRQDLPRALAYWRAAGLMMPRDGHVQHNVALARSELSRVPQPVGAPRWWMNLTTPGEVAFLGLVLGFIGSSGLFVRRRRRSARWPWVSVWVLGLWLVVSGLWTLWQVHDGAVAVVVDAPAVLRDAPALAANQRQTLPPGTEVFVEAAESGFLYIRTGEDVLGWVADGAVLRVPR